MPVSSVISDPGLEWLECSFLLITVQALGTSTSYLRAQPSPLLCRPAIAGVCRMMQQTHEHRWQGDHIQAASFSMEHLHNTSYSWTPAVTDAE